MKTPTTATLASAVKKAETMWGVYECRPGQIPGTVLVQHKADPRRCYCVDKALNECSCPAFEYDGACKHQAFAHEWERIEEGEAMADLIAEGTGRAAMAAAKSWPVCAYHGPHYAAENGSPMSFCDRCQDLALA